VVLIILFLILICLLIYKTHIENKFYMVQYLTEKSLNNFIFINFKKRKNDKNNMKNHIKHCDYGVKYQYLHIILRKTGKNSTYLFLLINVKLLPSHR
jgi:hypothetical protein